MRTKEQAVGTVDDVDGAAALKMGHSKSPQNWLKLVETHWWFEDHGDFDDFGDFVPAEFGMILLVGAASVLL
jgi:hypothetical protein